MAQNFTDVAWQKVPQWSYEVCSYALKFLKDFNTENVGLMSMKYLDNVSERIKLMF